MRTTNPHLQRGQLLLGQGRFDLAERELRQAIAHDPNEAEAFSCLSLCLAEREQWKEATEAARQAVSLDPGSPYPHYALASVLCDRNMPEEARASAEEAIRLNPHDADFWAMRAQIDVTEKKFKEALEAAERGLVIDARHEACVNLRAMALTNLGKKKQASLAIDANLQRNPQNAYTHANMGWALLHQSQPRQALEHFREALRLQPGMEHARLGLIEALKARNFIYRVFLAYFLFMSRMQGRTQWFILIGGYLGYQAIRTVSKSNPSLSAYLDPIVAAYLVFAIGTIVTVPLFNLFLFLDRFGRHALSREQRWASTAFGLSLIPPIVFLVMWGVTGLSRYSLAALLAGLFVIPVSLTGGMRAGTPRVTMISIAAVLGAVGALFCTLVVWRGWGLGILGAAYAIACVGSTWIANIFSTMRPSPKH